MRGRLSLNSCDHLGPSDTRETAGLFSCSVRQRLIKNETPKPARGDGKPEWAFLAQIPHTRDQARAAKWRGTVPFEPLSHSSRWRLDWLAGAGGSSPAPEIFLQKRPPQKGLELCNGRRLGCLCIGCLDDTDFLRAVAENCDAPRAQFGGGGRLLRWPWLLRCRGHARKIAA